MWEHLPEVIVYTRHPQCWHNADHEGALARGIENRLSPLTKAGELQRDFTAAYLVKEFETFDAVFCSTYKRTRAIPEAAKLCEHLIEDTRLDERNMGVWHRHPRVEVLKRYPGEDKKIIASGYYHYHAPEGETCLHVEDKLKDFLADERMFAGCARAYISGHGISGLCLWRILTDATLEQWHAGERLKNASVSVYRKLGNRYVCEVYNHIPWEGHINPELLKKGGGEI